MSYMFGIGKLTALKVLKSGMILSLLGCQQANIDDAVSEATRFVAACYGSKSTGDLSEIHYAIWASKMANIKLTSAPKLKSLPPTTGAFKNHVHRAHHQTAIWKSSLAPDPSQMCNTAGDTDDNSTLSLVMLPVDVSPVPVDVLQIIKCGCSTEHPCSSGRCGCVVAQMSCSMFCRCHATPECNNCHTRTTTSVDEDEDSA